jgi:hypothetical protein
MWKFKESGAGDDGRSVRHDGGSIRHHRGSDDDGRAH